MASSRSILLATLGSLLGLLVLGSALAAAGAINKADQQPNQPALVADDNLDNEDPLASSPSEEQNEVMDSAESDTDPDPEGWNDEEFQPLNPAVPLGPIQAGSGNSQRLVWPESMIEGDEEPSRLDSNIENAKIQLNARDMATAAGHHHHHKHYVHGWLKMGAHTGKKGSFGWHDKHPVGGKGRR